MHSVSSTATQTGGITVFLRRFQSDTDKVKENAIVDLSVSHQKCDEREENLNHLKSDYSSTGAEKRKSRPSHTPLVHCH